MPSARTMRDAYEPLARGQRQGEVRAGRIWLRLFDLVNEDARAAMASDSGPRTVISA